MVCPLPLPLLKCNNINCLFWENVSIVVDVSDDDTKVKAFKQNLQFHLGNIVSCWNSLSRSVIHWWCVRFCCQNGEYFAKCALQRHMPLVPLKHWVQTMQGERERKHCKTVHVWMSWIVLITHWWQNYFEFGARIRNHSHIGIPYICSGGISCVCVCVWRKESKRMLTVALQNSQHHWQDCKFSVSHTQGCENTS